MTTYYFKSDYTGQCYKDTQLPQFGGYTIITEEEYNNYWATR